MLTAAVNERGKRLETKAQQGRATASIDKLLPAGTVDLDEMPERGDFGDGAAGDAAWATAVDGNSYRYPDPGTGNTGTEVRRKTAVQ